MRRIYPFATALLLAAGACGPAELVVTLEVEAPDAESESGMVTRALSDLEVQLLPYDRDAVFDSLEAAYPEPEPTIPQDLLDERNAVQEAQERWRQLDQRWSTLRDTLQAITTAMEQFNPAESRYRLLYNEFQEFDAQLGRIERQRDRAFQEFDELQRGTIQRSDSMRIQIDNWADEAFADAFDVFVAKERLSGLRAVVDTTDAGGMVRIEAKPGQYWIHARYELPYTELYWNVPVTLERGEPTQIRLTRENAEERIKL